MSTDPKPATAAQFAAALTDWAVRKLVVHLVAVPSYHDFAFDTMQVSFVSLPDGDLPPARVTIAISVTAYDLVLPTAPATAEEPQP